MNTEFKPNTCETCALLNNSIRPCGDCLFFPLARGPEGRTPKWIAASWFSEIERLKIDVDHLTDKIRLVKDRLEKEYSVMEDEINYSKGFLRGLLEGENDLKERRVFSEEEKAKAMDEIVNILFVRNRSYEEHRSDRYDEIVSIASQFKPDAAGKKEAVIEKQ